MSVRKVMHKACETFNLIPNAKLIILTGTPCNPGFPTGPLGPRGPCKKNIKINLRVRGAVSKFRSKR